MDPRVFRHRRGLPIAVALLAIVVIWLLPDLQQDPSEAGLPPVAAARGVVLDVEPGRFDPDPPAGDMGGEILVRVLEGPREGEELWAFVALPFTQAAASDFEIGDEIVVTFTDQPGGAPLVGVGERWRLPVIVLLVLVFAATILLVGGWHGLRALLALALTVVVVIKLLVPAILVGVPPVPLAILIAGLITVTTIFLTEGVGRASMAAILGTAGGLLITGAVSAIVGVAAELSGAPAGELFLVEFASGESLDTRGLLLAAIIIGAVGVLDDMTVTQAATVEGLARRPSSEGGEGLWGPAMRIGRSHVAATVNTLFMAYVGASLPALVFLVVAAEPAILALDREVLALEVVRTLGGSLGIVLAMPLTTAIAIHLVRRDRRRLLLPSVMPATANSMSSRAGPRRPSRPPEAEARPVPEGQSRPRSHGLRRRPGSRGRGGP